MWNLDQIEIEIEDADGSEMIVVIDTPVGPSRIAGEVRLVSGILTIDGAHVQGLSPGALTRVGLNAIGLKLLEVTGAHSLVLQGGSRTTGRNPGRAPRPIRFPHARPALDAG